MIHMMKLNPEPFERVKSGTKTIEYRLNDEKRQKVKAGDIIIFNNEDLQIEVKVTEVIYAHNFSELRTVLYNAGYIKNFNEFDPAAMRKYYSIDDEHKYGVVGIRIYLVKKEDTKNPYCEKFNEQSYVTVAEYVLCEKINGKDKLSICGTAFRGNVRIISLKLRSIFSTDMLDSMAYYIKMLDGTVDSSEFDTFVSSVPHISRNDVEAVLKFACGLKYSLYGIRSRRELGKYIDGE